MVTWLWRLRRPEIYSQQAEDTGKAMIQFQFEPEGLRTKRAGSVSFSQSLKAGENQYPSSKTVRKREGILPYSMSFCSTQAFNGLDQTHLHQGWQSALLNLPIQTLISSRNTLTDTPRAMLSQI